MHWHSLSFEPIAKSFELFAVLHRVPASAKTQIEPSGHANRNQPQHSRLISSHKIWLARSTRYSTPQKSALQNGAEGVFLNGVGGLPPQAENRGLNAVLKRFDSSKCPIWAFLAFTKAGHLPSSPSNHAATHLLRSPHEKSPHPTPFQKNGLFRPANRKGRALLYAQSSTWRVGFSALPHPPHAICRSRPPSSAGQFGTERPCHICSSSGRLVCPGMSTLLYSPPCPSVRAGVFVAAA